MATSRFGEKTIFPNETMIAEALAESKTLWGDIKSHVTEICGDVATEWKFYSKKAGWSLVVKSGKRTILYMIPQNKFFKVNFVFGEKAVASAIASGLPKSVVALIESAVPYSEGRSFMFDVTNEKEVDTVKKLIAIKNSNQVVSTRDKFTDF